MEFCKKIDKSLTERHTIVNLLESLKKENITLEEMERIGAKLQKAGKRALSPLIRRLWREQNGDHISRYVYLLDFFDDEVWIDQIARIALKRNDLGEDGKAALLSVLEDYGIDVNVPPFSKLLEGMNGPLELTLPRLFDKGEAGTIRFMEDFLSYPKETQAAVVRYLARLKDRRVLSLFEILLTFDDREIVLESIATLGRVRERGAASLLNSFHCGEDAELREMAARSLRRLSFLGITPEPPPENAACTATFSSSVSSVDGSGSRTLRVSRQGADGRLDVLFMQFHDMKGMVDALGYSNISREKHDSLLSDVVGEEVLMEIDADYAALLIGDALFMNRCNETHLPPEFYVLRGFLPAAALTPESYAPVFNDYNLERLADSSELLEQSGSLFEEEYFDGWFTADSRLFDLAEDLNLLEDNLTGRGIAQAVENFIEKFIGIKVERDSDSMARRLFMIADLMGRTGSERPIVEKTLAVAMNLLTPRAEYRKIPFLRQYAVESLKIIRDAIAEGFDPRLQTEWDDDDLWD